MKIEDLFQHCKVHKIYGTAGAGKTTYLIDELHKLFETGVRPEQIGFVSFTKKAVNELIERSLKKFKQFDEKQFKHFKTIHAMCYANIHCRSKAVIQRKELKQVADSIGLQISLYNKIEDGQGAKQGDKVLQIESLARLRMVDLKTQCRESNYQNCPLFLVKHWRERLIAYKEKNDLIDFSDMLELYDSILPVDYLFIDEAQDLCPLQWKVMDKASKICKKVYIAGDDDQAIYNWAGAEVEYLLNIKSDEESILAISHRLPEVIYKLSRNILKRIKVRKEKESEPLKKEGSIKYLLDFQNVVFKEEEEYLILVRNRWQINSLKRNFFQKGIPFLLLGKNSLDVSYIDIIEIWERSRKTKYIDEVRKFEKMKKYSTFLKKYSSKEDIDKSLFNNEWYKIFNLIPRENSFYIRNVLRNGYKLSYEPKIKISTIHQAKGGESDNVILFQDVSTSVWNHIHSDFEHKVWYVAVTRTKKNLFIIREQGSKFYRI